MPALTIGKAARDADVNVETVRFYERRGLIARPPKGQGYRIYSAEQVAQIRFIKEAQRIGFSLKEIRDLLALRADPTADCSEVRSQAVAKLDDIKWKIDQLRKVGAALEKLIVACPGHGQLQACSIMDALTVQSNKSPGTNPRGRPRRSQQSAEKLQMKTSLFKIDGMHCDGCANTIKAVVERQAGVQMATVSYERGEARILYDSHAIGEDRLASIINRIGYRATAQST